MSRIKSKLSKLEIRLQSLVEGGSARIFPANITRQDVLGQLTDAMLAGVKTRPDRGRVAPNLYTLVLPKDSSEAIQKESMLLDELAKRWKKPGRRPGWLS